MNGDRRSDIGDAILVLAMIFGETLPAPFPDCGFDPAPGGFGCATSSCDP